MVDVYRLLHMGKICMKCRKPCAQHSSHQPVRVFCTALACMAVRWRCLDVHMCMTEFALDLLGHASQRRLLVGLKRYLGIP